MKTIRFIVLLIAIAVMTSASTATAGDLADIGARNLTVASITVGTGSATGIGTLPSYVDEVRAYAIDGDVNYGPASVTTGVYSSFIASGSYIALPTDIRSPSWYFRGRTGTATVALVGF